MSLRITGDSGRSVEAEEEGRDVFALLRSVTTMSPDSTGGSTDTSSGRAFSRKSLNLVNPNAFSSKRPNPSF
ncbi:hypothetical protein D3C81_1192920 [compost metagenome]